MERITVLCYGDSNTYGYNPANGLRYPEGVRWTSRLQMLLGDAYKVVEEGCNGRTTVYEDPFEQWKKGIDFIRPCLNSHKPVDIVILMLGSNDMKKIFHTTPDQVAKGAEEIVKVILEFTENKQGFQPKIMLVSPPEIGSGVSQGDFGESFEESAVEASRELPKWFQEVAERNGCILVNAAEFVKPSQIDHLHLMPEDHGALAQAFCDVIKTIQE